MAIDVSLVVMPYAAIERPSVGVGMLTACLKKVGITVKGDYANLWFADRIGLKTYHLVSRASNTDLLGEWTFAGAAFPDLEADHGAYFRRLERRFPGDPPAGLLGLSPTSWMEIRAIASSFVDEAAQRILEAQPAIVGCSSVFQQHCASLALLRRIREQNPEVVTVLGGANCEGSMGAVTHAAFKWVDYVVAGDAEVVFPDLCTAILDGPLPVPAGSLPTCVRGPEEHSSNRGELGSGFIEDLDELSAPDYDDYFDELEALGLRGSIKPGLPVEFARGCWWGERHKCRFCGLNGCGIRHRRKSAGRILAEVEALTARHRTRRVQVVDNNLDLNHLREVLPRLRQRDSRLSISCETTASLGRHHVRTLADSGVAFIQAGIETMHDELLRLLGKSNSVVTNICLLKWAAEHGIYVVWNFLTGIPGEADRCYQEMAAWLPFVFHLQPPSGGINRIRFDRFSPYWERPGDHGIELAPLWSYSHVFPLDPASMVDIAYYFENRNQEELPIRPGTGQARVTDLVATWRDLFFCDGTAPGARDARPDRPRLEARLADGGLVITDTRTCATTPALRLDDHLDRAVLRASEPARAPAAMVRALRNSGYPGIEWRDVEPIAERFLESRIMIRIGDRLLSLVVAEPQVQLPLLAEHPGGTVWLRGRGARQVVGGSDPPVTGG